MASKIFLSTQLMGILVVLSHFESYIHFNVDAIAPDVSNAFWTYLFDENSYENEQDSSEFGIPLTDLNDKAEERMMAAENIKELRPEAFELEDALNNAIKEYFYIRAIKRGNTASMSTRSKNMGVRITKKDLDDSAMEDVTTGMGQKLAEYQRILDRYLGRI